MDKYLHFTSLDLAQDDSFIQWIKGNDDATREKWNFWLEKHPEKKEIVEEARKIVQSLKFKEEKIDTETKDKIWANIEDQTSKPGTRKTGGAVIRKFMYAAVAAVILFFVFVKIITPVQTEFKTSYAQTMSQELPDGSSAALNAESVITYNKDNWKTNRFLTLEGEAFFKVKKGETFQVKTKNGIVSVLGTSFNVFSRGNQLFVQCETGKVSVKTNNDETILVANESVKVVEGQHGEKTTIEAQGHRSDWQIGVFTFNNVPVTDVIDELERQLDVEIMIDPALIDRSYTGSFKLSNKEDALSEVFWPLNLQFTISGRKVTIFK